MKILKSNENSSHKKLIWYSISNYWNKHSYIYKLVRGYHDTFYYPLFVHVHVLVVKIAWLIDIVLIPFENISLKKDWHHCGGKAAEIRGLCLAWLLRSLRDLYRSHLLCKKTSIYTVSSEGPYHAHSNTDPYGTAVMNNCLYTSFIVVCIYVIYINLTTQGSHQDLPYMQLCDKHFGPIVWNTPDMA